MFIHALENGITAQEAICSDFTLNPVSQNLFKGLGELNKGLIKPGN